MILISKYIAVLSFMFLKNPVSQYEETSGDKCHSIVIYFPRIESMKYKGGALNPVLQDLYIKQPTYFYYTNNNNISNHHNIKVVCD